MKISNGENLIHPLMWGEALPVRRFREGWRNVVIFFFSVVWVVSTTSCGVEPKEIKEALESPKTKVIYSEEKLELVIKSFPSLPKNQQLTSIEEIINYYQFDDHTKHPQIENFLNTVLKTSDNHDVLVVIETAIQFGILKNGQKQPDRITIKGLKGETMQIDKTNSEGKQKPESP